MKLNLSSLTAGAGAVLFALATPTTTLADVKEAARKLHEDSNASLIGIRALLKIDVTMNGQPAGNQESPIWGNATMIGEGLALTAYSTLVPDVAAQAPGGGGLPPGVEVKTKLNEVKFVDSSGEEFDAKLILHDEDLDLAFLAIDPKAENADSWEIGAVDISSDPTAELLDDVITMARQPSTLRFASSLKVGSVTSVVKRPRVMYAVDGISPGAPAFTQDGTFLGMVTLRRAADKKQQPVPVILPAQYLRKLVPQAQEKQEELKTAEPEEEAGGEAPAGEPEAREEEIPAEVPAGEGAADESETEDE